eukprot:374055_1
MTEDFVTVVITIVDDTGNKKYKVNYTDICQKTVHDIKQQVIDNFDSPLENEQTWLLHNSDILQSNKTLTYYDIPIQSGATILMYLCIFEIKLITNNGAVLWMRNINNVKQMSEALCSHHNLSIERQKSLILSKDNVFKLNVNIKPNEIVLLIQYDGSLNEHPIKRFIFIDKNAPLYIIGEILKFYPPKHFNEKSDLELTYNNIKLNVYKTANDYCKILKQESILHATLILKPNNTLYNLTKSNLLI